MDHLKPFGDIEVNYILSYDVIGSHDSDQFSSQVGLSFGAFLVCSMMVPSVAVTNTSAFFRPMIRVGGDGRFSAERILSDKTPVRTLDIKSLVSTGNKFLIRIQFLSHGFKWLLSAIPDTSRQPKGAKGS